ncbi:hypothetical protein HMPREF9225_1988 [Peptoniphilus duerdenii ATCC BAA-1640]|uniref:Uncharacterized protein n=1 Tax=Peptoniphilus duerdenii ATCC BAA-1640 TaxID=862517 RepID=E0NP99_9FIRM|nr:hypothetical protein HMPREF9225_1988 [Peptoniphilus duerdenii ATCC BAA-1640]
MFYFFVCLKWVLGGLPVVEMVFFIKFQRNTVTLSISDEGAGVEWV